MERVHNRMSLLTIWFQTQTSPENKEFSKYKIYRLDQPLTSKWYTCRAYSIHLLHNWILCVIREQSILSFWEAYSRFLLSLEKYFIVSLEKLHRMSTKSFWWQWSTKLNILLRINLLSTLTWGNEKEGNEESQRKHHPFHILSK